MKRNFNRHLLPIFLTVIFSMHLAFIYKIKYTSHGLSVLDFDLFNAGNIINLVITLTVIGLVFLSYKKGDLKAKRTGYIIISVISTLILFSAELSKTYKFPLPEIYFFDQPFPRIFTGILFALYQFCVFYFIFLLSYGMKKKNRFNHLKSMLNAVILIAGILFIVFFYLRPSQSKISAKKSDTDKTRVGVVLGAAVWSGNVPSPSLASRSEKAAELYRLGHIDRIQLTGSNAPGELTEARVAYNYIVQLGVDSSVISLEENTRSTTEQIFFIKDYFLDQNNPYLVIIISDSYHLPRVKEISRFYGLDVQVAASGLTPSFEGSIYYKIRESIALIVFWFFAL